MYIAEENEIILGIFRVVSRFPLHFSEILITFWTVQGWTVTQLGRLPRPSLEHELVNKSPPLPSIRGSWGEQYIIYVLCLVTAPPTSYRNTGIPLES